MMRQKAFMLFLTCVIFTTLAMLLLPRRRGASFNRIVQETQEKISHLSENLLPDAASTDLLSPSPVYLATLGLSGPGWPQLYPHGSWLISQRTTQPTLVSAVESGQAELALGFIRSTNHFLPDTNLLLYDLGVSRYEKELLARSCNSSLCSLLQFDYSQWPGHVRDLKLHAYRPIIIQMSLRDIGSIVWLDIDCRLTESNLKPWLEQAATSGIVAWEHEPTLATPSSQGPVRAAVATTALTHPKMFEFFDSRKYEDYAFQHMCSSSSLVLLYNQELHTHLMLPWLKCILTESCINPIGAQDTGCRFDKKPQYRYSGCHRYDMSALNIVLGDMFQFQENKYLGNKPFFRRVNQDPSSEKSVTPSNFSMSRDLISLEM